MLTRLRSRSTGRGGSRRGSSSSDDPAMDDGDDATGAAAAAAAGKSSRGGGRSSRSAFGNKASNAANRNADGGDGGGKKKKKKKRAATGPAAAAASNAPVPAAAVARAGGKRGRQSSSSAAAAADVKPKKEKRTTRSSSRGRTGGAAKAAAKKQAGSKRKAVKSEPDSDSSDEEERTSSKNKRAKKESGKTTGTSSRSSRSAMGASTSIKSEADHDDDASSDDNDNNAIVPRDLSDEFLVPPEYRLQRSTFGDGTNLTSGLAPQDVKNKDDVLHAAPYVSDLFQHLYEAETKDAPAEYMDDQPDINAKMRAILIDWLVEVHMKFRLVPETLYLCVNLIDRYCQLVDIKRSELQLVGVTALLVACKYEEIYPPEVRDCVYITDRAYLRQQVLDMEQDILAKLEFRITTPTAYPFLTRFLSFVDASDLVKHAASFYMERTLQEHDLLRYRPSVVAASAVILAMNNPSILDEEGKAAPGIPKVLLEYTGFAEKELRQVAKIICTKVGEEPVTASRRQLVAVKRKFDHDRYKHVSTAFDLPDPSHLDS